MEENITNKFISAKHESKKGLLEVQLPEAEHQDIKPNKVELEYQEPIPTADVVTKTEMKEKHAKNNGKVLKRKVTEDGVMIERVLSEGEASSGFETVSSYDSKDELDDLDLSSPFNGDDFNVIVKIENELAFKNSEESVGRVCYKDLSSSPFRYNSRIDRFLDEYRNRRSGSFRNFKDQKYGNNKNKSNRKDIKLNEREEFDRSRRSSGGGSSRRSRNSERNHCDRSRRSRSSDRIHKSRSSKSSERNNRLRSPSYKGRKKEARRSRSFDKNSGKSYIKRNSPSRKRRHSPFSKSPCSVWKRLDNRISPTKIKKNKKIKNNRQKKSAHNCSYRKKERTPFLVELERKLKEAEHLKNFAKETVDCSSDQSKTSGNVNAIVPLPEGVPGIGQSSTPLYSAAFSSSAPNVQGVICPLQYVSVPSLSMDNLPLVPGPTGLPVHITMTGEQIPYDMDGRRIPIGPNGYYLPLDPTGRLFPHIISPGNQAIPIHMTEDGVLRLPNSEPVPHGPGHQLPVNIDGSVILIGCDSKPLYPCPNLPKQPPLNLLQMMDSFSTGCVKPQTTQTGIQQNIVLAAQQASCINQISLQQPRLDLTLLEFVQNPIEKISKTNLLEKYQEKALERHEDTLKCLEIKRSLEVNSSKEEMKGSASVNMLQKKTFKDDSKDDSSGSNMVLDSEDSDCASGLKLVLEPIKGLTKEMILSSDDEQNILKAVYDTRKLKAQNIESKQDDPIVKKIQQAIKSLVIKNYQPPVFGRFIIASLTKDPVLKELPNESPLLRRKKLPFITICNGDVVIKKQPVIEKKPGVTFRFFPQKKSEDEEKPSCIIHRKNTHFSSAKLPVFTFDFSVQCDFTSAIIKNLNTKVSELEMELVRLKNVNSSLVDGYKNLKALNEKKNDELMKAMVEIQEKDSEIRSLKRSVGKQ